ncbi:unnamed protein product, partial [Brassica oleracea]
QNISGCYTINGFAQTLQGRKGRKQFKDAILSQTRVINFVQKDIDQMFPKWEFDIEDTPAENIIKLIFPAVVSPAKKKVVKEDSPRPRKKAHKEAPAEASEEAAAEASDEVAAEASEEVTMTIGGITTKRKGTSSQNTTSPPKPTLEPGSESVNGTNAGRKSLAEDKGPDVPADASSSKDKAPESSLQSLYTANSTARVIILNKKLYPGYNPFAPIDKKKLKELADWLKTYPLQKLIDFQHFVFAVIIEHLSIKNHVKVELGDDLPIIRLHIDAWINVLRKRYDANPQNFRSERMCFLVHLFAHQWRFNFKDFKDSEPDQNVLGRRLPGGAWNYYAGTIPSFCQSNKVWGTDIDDIYAPVNYADTHWIAMWISIPKRHIVVFDSICSSISPEELDVVMEPFLYMVPYLLVECAYSDEQRVQYNLEPFTYERPANIPPARAGDCGVYTLKYIECHALGIEFSKIDFAKANGKTMRDTMAVDIFQELPDAHEFENKDNDANLGAYEGRLTVKLSGMLDGLTISSLESLLSSDLL